MQYWAVITGIETLPLILIPLAVTTVNTKWNPWLKRIIFSVTLTSIVMAAVFYLMYH